MAWSFSTFDKGSHSHGAGPLCPSSLAGGQSAQGIQPWEMLQNLINVRQTITLVGDHQMGTCRMGDDPAASVVNRFCRLHEAENVFVVDSSFMPSEVSLSV